MPLTLAQQARIAKKKQDALDRKRQKEAEREAKRARHEEQEQAAAPAPAPEVPRGLRAHNGVGLREAPLHARRRSVPVRRFSAETPTEDEPAAPHPPADDVAPPGAPREQAAASAPAPAPAARPPAGPSTPGVGVAATPSSGAMAWVLASELAAAETPAAPAAAPRAVTESPPSPPAAARAPEVAPSSPLRFAEASDDDAAAAPPEPDASDEDSVVFLGSNAAAPAPAAQAPAPAPVPAPVPAEEEGPRCGHGKLATEHCPQCAAFLAYEASHGMLVLDQSLAAEGAPPPPSHVIVGKPRTSLDKAEECVVCICVEINARRRREILISTQVCMDNVGSQVLNPCAHRVCDGCAKKLGECPMCRQKMVGFRGGAAFMPVGSPEGRAIVAAARGEVVPAPAPAPAAAPRRTKPRNVLERWVGASSTARPAKKPASRRKKR